MSHISSFALHVKAVNRKFHRTFLPIYVRENSCTPLTTTYMNSKAIFCWLVNESWRTKYEDESYIIRVHKHLWEIVQLWNKFLKQKGQHKWFQKKIKIPVYRKFSIFTTDSRLNSSDPWKCAQLFARNSQAKNTMPLLARGILDGPQWTSICILLNYNLLLTEREDLTLPYWGILTHGRDKRRGSISRTVVWPEQAMLVSSLLRGKIQSFVWQNHDQERTNQDTRFYLKITLPYKNVFYIMPEKIQPIIQNTEKELCTQQ